MRARPTASSTAAFPSVRLYLIQIGICLAFFFIIARMFYWQVIYGPIARAQANDQYTSYAVRQGYRGKIYSRDGHLLVGNMPEFTLFGQPQILTESPQAIAQSIAPLIASTSGSVPAVTSQLTTRLDQKDKKWVALANRITPEQREKIKELNFTGIGFDEYETRSYPEASLSAHVLGFVGKNDDGEPTGYFGIEGKMNRELSSQDIVVKTEKDAQGKPLFFQANQYVKDQHGRDITLTIQRDMQYLLETELQRGVSKYGAVSGEAVIMDPSTGEIMAMAVTPSYHPKTFFQFPNSVFKNPLAADSYEPGSTFKVLTMSAGIDAGVVSPDTACTSCGSARTIADYTIKTWNDQYIPGITMKDALAKSDNTAMIFVAEQLGRDKFVEYLHKFQIGEKSGVELQEDAPTQLKETWRPIDLATASFGQGIAVTGLQMIKAVGAIANHGTLVQPHLIHSVNVDGKQLEVPIEVLGQPISTQSANTVRDMMVYAAQKGEAQWTTSKQYTVAGKTGTAQVPVAGHYDEDKTIASYVGFAPAYDPKFVMLIKLQEPQSSQWASETAAPLWYDIAHQIFALMNVPPDRE